MKKNYATLSFMKRSTLIKGLLAGMLGGLAGNFLMYLFATSLFTLLRWPGNTSFSIIGDSAAAFMSQLGIVMEGGAPLGFRLYFLIGLLIGAVWGLGVVVLPLLRRAAFWKQVGVSILYVQVVSIPLLAAGIFALKLQVVPAATWIGFSFVLHLVFGLVLGVVTRLGVGDQFKKITSLARKGGCTLE